MWLVTLFGRKEIKEESNLRNTLSKMRTMKVHIRNSYHLRADAMRNESL